MKNRMIKWLVGLACIGLAFSASATTWTYSDGTYDKTTGKYKNGTITDGQWTLKVSDFTPTEFTLGTTGISSYKTPDDLALSGILDLRSPNIVVDGQSIELKTIRLGGNAFPSWDANTSKIVEFYCDIVSSMGAGCFTGNSSLKDVFIGGPLTSLNATVLKGKDNNSGIITNVVLDLPNLTSVAGDAFQNQAKLSRVELVTAFSDMGQVTNVVRYTNNRKTDSDVPVIGNLRIYVSKKQWKPSEAETYSSTNLTGFFADKSTITDTEKESIDAETLENVIGVLVKNEFLNNSNKGTRKGIFVHKASKYDKPTGFAISVR